MEVLSPSTEKYDRTEKMELYKQQEIDEYWIVDWRKRQVDIYTLDYDEEEKELYMPDVGTQEDFSKLLSPLAIHILSVHNNGQPYIGFEFSCSWDIEHDFGVMMLYDRVVKLGGADTSFLTWIAEEDFGKKVTVD